jgi:hypothetical protein
MVHTTIDEGQRVILDEIYDSHEPSELLGWLFFQYDNSEKGSLYMANCGAQIDFADLGIGHSTKRGDEEQELHLSGRHGDGLKAAALTFRRNDYSYRFVTRGKNHVFNFGRNGMLHAHVTRVSEKLMQEEEDIVKKQGRKTIFANPCDGLVTGQITEIPRARSNGDVIKIIGEKKRGTTKQIDLGDYLRWRDGVIDFARMDLIKSGHIFRTIKGELITEKKYRKIYLRGLELPQYTKDPTKDPTQDPTKDPMNFHFGYNLFSGETSPDRERITNRNEMSRTITQIWAECLFKEKGVDTGAKKYTEHYVDILINHPNAADVRNIDKDLSPKTVNSIWKHLCLTRLDKDGLCYFFHPPNLESTVSHFSYEFQFSGSANDIFKGNSLHQNSSETHAKGFPPFSGIYFENIFQPIAALHGPSNFTNLTK